MALSLVVRARGLALTVTPAPPPPAVVVIEPLPRVKPRPWLRILRPDGSDRSTIDINTDVTALRTTRQLPGGAAECTLGIHNDDAGVYYGYLPAPIEAHGGDTVEVWVGSQRIWRGTVEETLEPDGLLRGITASGLAFGALNDDFYASGPATTATTAVIVRDVLRRVAPWVTLAGPERMLDPGKRHQFSDFSGLTAGQLLDQVTKEGGGADDVPWTYALDTEFSFEPLVLPVSGPHYAVPLNGVQLRRNWRWVHSKVTVFYTVNGLERSVTRENAAVVDHYGIRRHAPINGPSNMSDSAAVQFALTWLGEHSRPQITASFGRSFEQGLERAAGDMREIWLVREGEWVQLLPQTDDIPPLPITQLDLDWFTAPGAAALSITLGQPTTRSLRGLFTRLKQTDDAVRTGLNPVTGGRAR